MVHVLGKSTNEFDVRVDFTIIEGYSKILKSYRYIFRVVRYVDCLYLYFKDEIRIY